MNEADRCSEATLEIQRALRQRGFLELANDAATIRRFAATRDYNVAATLELFVSYHGWRTEVGLPTLRAEDCRDELMKCHVLRLCEEGGSLLGGPTARDVEGHPVIYKSLMNCPPGGCQRDVDRAHAFIFDRVCAEMDAGGSVDTFTVLLDLTMTSKRALDFASIGRLSHTLKVGFRGRLHRLYIYPAGRLERLAFFGCKGFLAPSTRRKVVIIRRGELAQLWGRIPRHVLPEHLGGTNAHIRLGDAVRCVRWSTLCGKPSLLELPPESGAGADVEVDVDVDAATPRAAPEGALGSQVEDTTIALLGEQRPAAAAAAEGVMEEEHAGALVPAHALEEEQEEPEDVWPWVPRELDDAFWGACRNAVSTLGLLAVGVDYGHLRGVRAGNAHQVLSACLSGTCRCPHRWHGLPFPAVVPALTHGVLGWAIAGLCKVMPRWLGLGFGLSYFVGRVDSYRSRRTNCLQVRRLLR